MTHQPVGPRDRVGDDDHRTRDAVVASRYLDDLAHAAHRIDRQQLGAAVSMVHAALAGGRRVYVAGNGGSASASVHIASDWSEVAYRIHAGQPVVSLAENVARLTAIANDRSYDDVFAEQIRSVARPGDLLVVLSVSGDSANLRRAVEAARGAAVDTVGVLGHRGEVAPLLDHVVVMGDQDYGITEDLHIAFGHMVVRALDGGRARVVAPCTGPSRRAVDQPGRQSSSERLALR